MKIFVGSTNTVKVNAVKIASQALGNVEVIGIEVESGVSAQPRSEEETRTGAENRARFALEKGMSGLELQNGEEVLGLGLEGGVFEKDAQMWSTVWGVVVDRNGNVYQANGARIQVAEVIAQRIRAGEEMGPIVEKVAGITDVRSKQGMIGVVTNNFVTRTEEYANIAKLALGVWYGRDWDKNL